MGEVHSNSILTISTSNNTVIDTIGVSDGIAYTEFARFTSTNGIPEIDVQGGNPLASIPDGDTTPNASDGSDFGNAVAGEGSVSKTFSIINSGNADLFLSGVPAVALSGSNAAEFTVTQQPITPIAAGDTSTFTITFKPTEEGLRSAVVNIANNDANEHPYDFVIQGNGTPIIPTINGLLVAERSGGKVTAIDPITGDISLIANLANANGIILEDGDNVLVTTLSSSGALVRVNLTTGNTTNIITGLSNPQGITKDIQGEIYVVEEGSQRRVSRVDFTNGTLAPIITNLNFPVDAVFLDNDIVLVSEFATGQVIRVDLNNDERSIVISGLGGPTDLDLLQINGETELVVAEYLNGKVSRFKWPGFNLIESGSFSGAHGVATDDQNNRFITDFNSGNISKVNSDKVTSTLTTGLSQPVFTVFSGTSPLVPEMAVQGGSPLIVIPDNDASAQSDDGSDFGVASVNNGTTSRIFTIVNTGKSTLNLSGSPRVELSGANAGDFTVSQQPSSLIEAGTSTSFEVSFDPSTDGIRDATISIANNDADENPYNFAIRGVASAENWSGLGAGADGQVLAMVADNGLLYGAGSFLTASGLNVNRIAVWDGQQWSALGNGMNSTVRALAIDENGNLYAGGDFITADSLYVNHIAVWNGNNWSALDDGMNDNVHTLEFHNGILYAGGNFTKAGGVDANYIAQWDGTIWSSLKNGMNNNVNDLSINTNNGDLIATGDFTIAGGVSASNIAQWNGSNWSQPGTSTKLAGLKKNETGNKTESIILSAVAVDANGHIYVGGKFSQFNNVAANNIVKWDGISWTALGAGVDSTVHTLEIDGAGLLHVGGDFSNAGTVSAMHLATWDGSNWSAPSGGTDGPVSAFTLDENGNLYAGGDYSNIGGSGAGSIAAIPTLAPEVELLGGNPLIVINDGDNSPQFSDGTDFGNVDVNNTAQTQVFTVRNNGNVPLTINPVFLDEGSPEDFTVTTQPAGQLASGASTTFEVSFAPQTLGEHVAFLSFTSSDLNESPYNFAIRGNGTGIPADATLAYTANSGDNTLSVIETSTNLVAQTVTVGNNPEDIAITPNGAFAYVVNSASNDISVLETATNTVQSTVNVGNNPQSVAITDNGDFAYVTNYGSGSVSVIETAGNTVTSTVAVGSNPQGVTLSPNGTFAYVANAGSDNISVIETSGNTVLTTIGVSGSPHSITFTPDGALAYVTLSDTNSVSIIETSGNTVVTSVIVGSNPKGIEVTPGGELLYVANSGSDDLSAIEVSSNSVVETIAIGNGPEGVSISPDGTFVYVSNRSSNNISVLVAFSNIVAATIPVGNAPAGIDIKFPNPITGVENNETVSIPEVFAIGQNYPNPFNPTTTITYQLPKRANVELIVFNVLGQKVNTLLDLELEPGAYRIMWNGRSDTGVQMPSGVYFYRLSANGRTIATKKMLLLR